mmetsp:Transcript_8284/g.18801  ORF Transcript_8284/g.18801 Transcript_8284/m.18801 type:complete len:99 (-) Transcript_8284:41-337(-)
MEPAGVVVLRLHGHGLVVHGRDNRLARVALLPGNHWTPMLSALWFQGFQGVACGRASTAWLMELPRYCHGAGTLAGAPPRRRLMRDCLLLFRLIRAAA